MSPLTYLLFALAILLVGLFQPYPRVYRWFSRLFADTGATSPDQLPRTRMQVAMPPVAPPRAEPLSCFVQGVIRSLETEPDQWGLSSYADATRAYSHATLHTTIQMGGWHSNAYPGSVSGYTLTRAECEAIYAALSRHVIEAQRRKAAEGFRWVAEQLARDRAVAKAAFEKLGCPTPS